MESSAYLTGTFWVMPLISFARLEAEILRSMTCVAPIDLRYSVCLREAVVMMGENPESFASWIPERYDVMHMGELLFQYVPVATYHSGRQNWIHQG